MEDGWEPIDTAPDDHNDERTVNRGVRSMLVRDRDGKEWRAAMSDLLDKMRDLQITDKQKKWLTYVLNGGHMPEIVGRALYPKGLTFKAGNDRSWSLTSAGRKLAEEIRSES